MIQDDRIMFKTIVHWYNEIKQIRRDEVRIIIMGQGVFVINNK